MYSNYTLSSSLTWDVLGPIRVASRVNLAREYHMLQLTITMTPFFERKLLSLPFPTTLLSRWSILKKIYLQL